MCRLMAVVGESWTPHTRHSLLSTMLLLSTADGAHTDGTGVTDGVNIWKTAQSSWAVDSTEWASTLDPYSPLYMAHVRKKSTGTGSKDSEAHPYVYDGAGLIMAHNGYFAGATGWVAQEPDTDSWRAGKILAGMLEKSPMTGSLLEEWLGNFNNASAFSLLMVYGGKLHVLRGKDRPLAFMLVGRDEQETTSFLHSTPRPTGVVINTSVDVLRAVRNLSLNFGVRFGPVASLEEGAYVVISPTGEVEHSSKLSWNLKSYTYVAPSTATKVAVVSAGGGGESSSSIRTTSNSLPKRTVSPATPEATERWLRIQTLKWFRRAFAPMSSVLIYRWARFYAGRSEGDNQSLTLDELHTFYEYATAVTPVPLGSLRAVSTNANFSLLSDHARSMIELWNSMVPQDKEPTVHDQLGVPFWEMPKLWSPQRLTTEVHAILSRI